ncbi:hypothetical protein C3L33_08545, partial [Rhododendron williamsianum]
MCFFERKGPSGFSKSSTAEEVTQGIDGTGLTAMLQPFRWDLSVEKRGSHDGASSGIGRETTRVLALHGVHVVMAVRNTDSGRKVKEAILEENPNAKIDVKELDLGSLASVRNFASEFKSLGFPLNLLINNAGVFAPPFMLSPDNIDLQFQTNHLGNYLMFSGWVLKDRLTDFFLELLVMHSLSFSFDKSFVGDHEKYNTSKPQRRKDSSVSSGSHWFAFRGIQFDRINDRINDESRYNRIYGYVQSKLANILHAKELAKRLKSPLAKGGCNATGTFLPATLIGYLMLLYNFIMFSEKRFSGSSNDMLCSNASTS